MLKKPCENSKGTMTVAEMRRSMRKPNIYNQHCHEFKIINKRYK